MSMLVVIGGFIFIIIIVVVIYFLTRPKSTSPASPLAPPASPASPLAPPASPPVPSVAISMPNLLSNKMQWQGSCENDTSCGGLLWHNSSTSPWNKYYQYSCVDNAGNESPKTNVFGPVSSYNFDNPVIRLQQNGINPCGNNKVKVYRGDTNTNLSQIKVRNFSNDNEYNGTDAIFVDSYAQKPNLINNNIQWQGNCTGEQCGGLVWTSSESTPWNKYYQFSCVDNQNAESEKSDVFGQVSNFNYHNPKIRVQRLGVEPCDDYKLKIYSGTDKNNLSPITPKNFTGQENYDGKSDVFTDI